MKKTALSLAILGLFSSSAALAASFTVSSGTTTGAQSLGASETGTVASGASLAVDSSSVAAITTTGNATITNSGTISGVRNDSDNRAIYANTANTSLTVTNNAGATITSAGADVIRVGHGTATVTFENYGTLTATGGQAIDFESAGANILNNHAGGIISSTNDDAVVLGANGQLTNLGTITGGSTSGTKDGVDAKSNSGVSITNSGTIQGTKHGITGAQSGSLAHTMTITNNAGGTISGTGGSGVNIDATLDAYGAQAITIVNHGTITGTKSSGDSDGIDVDGLAYITNTGTIHSLLASASETSEGVSFAGGTITNSGTIRGSSSAGSSRGITVAGSDSVVGVRQGLFANTTITNSGSIVGDTGSGIAVSGQATAFTATITNQAGGTIEGGGSEAAISATAEDVTVNNYGTIKATGSGAAIDFGTGASTLNVLGRSARLIGTLNGGTNAAGSTLNFDVGAARSYVFTTAGSWTLVDLDGRSVVAGSAMAAGIGNAETADEMQFNRMSSLNSALYKPMAPASAQGSWAQAYGYDTDRDASSSNPVITKYKADGYGVVAGKPIAQWGDKTDLILHLNRSSMNIDDNDHVIKGTSARVGLLRRDLYEHQGMTFSGKALLGYNHYDGKRLVLVNSGTTTGETTYTADFHSWELLVGGQGRSKIPLNENTALHAEANMDMAYEALGAYNESANFSWKRRQLGQATLGVGVGLGHQINENLSVTADVRATHREVFSGKRARYSINGTDAQFTGGDYHDTPAKISLGLSYKPNKDLFVSAQVSAGVSDNHINTRTAEIKVGLAF